VINLEKALGASYPAPLAATIVQAFRDIESNYALGKWKVSELDAGHFVEGARRILEHSLFGTFTPIGKSLPGFDDKELKRYEQAPGSDEFRILIPRVLKSIYGVRNKRGVGHLGTVSPNEMDATLILNSAKWVLAELLRLASGLSTSEAQIAVDHVIERRLSVLWKHDGVTRVLQSGLPARDQALILLYDENGQADEVLRSSIEYSNKSMFRTMLKKLHAKRLIEYRADSKCFITPKGVHEAESIIQHLNE
jgi:hypothetical protein